MVRWTDPMSREETLLSLSRASQNHEQMLRQELARQQQFLADLGAKMQLLQNFLAQYRAECARLEGQGVEVTRALDMRRFIAQLEQAMQFHESSLQGHRRRTAALLEEWKRARGKEKALAKILQHLRDLQQHQERKQMQKEIEQWVARSAGRVHG
ncbi:hypothetical protein A5904_07235 [Acidithiobacillus caldus]|uniref:Flagellar FliJ protein n=4 Tax=Acidithiobacillus caldus TaxID=33059 RepID=F9ZN94_ACICS|nr:conserved hypothetical protein [Acidithiobacillus caldus SM-1]AIA55125.1 hypothetical protein Acaty_c1257 [Acidithiobacillus caldus ATCC 51756]AUW32778.1 hypothetical protein A5904_07235 [Acidithiobacillus caldus]MBU2730255.1 hypothetical protein [Acidithiobacillus caldus]MBU2734328.1 hypothetical protein [Acidithiobacillus caldus ATCC 51756]